VRKHNVRKFQHSERGSGVLLLELLIVMMIVGVLMAALPASVFRTEQVRVENNAGSWMAQAIIAENQYESGYGAYGVSPASSLSPLSFLQVNLANPGCSAAGVASGFVANQAPADYNPPVLTGTGTTPASFTCATGTMGFQGYALSLTPKNP
jgi:type II secretory pathway pseudopilin PulG